MMNLREIETSYFNASGQPVLLEAGSFVKAQLNISKNRLTGEKIRIKEEDQSTFMMFDFILTESAPQYFRGRVLSQYFPLRVGAKGNYLHADDQERIKAAKEQTLSFLNGLFSQRFQIVDEDLIHEKMGSFDDLDGAIYNIQVGIRFDKLEKRDKNYIVQIPLFQEPIDDAIPEF